MYISKAFKWRMLFVDNKLELAELYSALKVQNWKEKFCHERMYI